MKTSNLFSLYALYFKCAFRKTGIINQLKNNLGEILNARKKFSFNLINKNIENNTKFSFLNIYAMKQIKKPELLKGIL